MEIQHILLVVLLLLLQSREGRGLQRLLHNLDVILLLAVLFSLVDSLVFLLVRLNWRHMETNFSQSCYQWTVLNSTARICVLWSPSPSIQAGSQPTNPLSVCPDLYVRLSVRCLCQITSNIVYRAKIVLETLQQHTILAYNTIKPQISELIAASDNYSPFFRSLTRLCSVDVTTLVGSLIG